MKGERVLLFFSVSGAMKAEKLLKQAGIYYKLMPVPRHLSSDCGIALKFKGDDEERVLKVLEGKVEIAGVYDL